MAELNLLFSGAVDMRKSSVGASGATVGMSMSSPFRRRTSKSSLFDIFQCKTAGGARLLRNSLLQPYCDSATLLSRLCMVDLLLVDEVSYLELCELLPLCSDLDHVSASMVQIPRQPSARTTHHQINLILSFAQTLEQMKRLHACVIRLSKQAGEAARRREKQRKKQARAQAQAHAQAQAQAQAQSRSQSQASNASSTTALRATPTVDHDEDVDSAARNQQRFLERIAENLSNSHYESLQHLILRVMDPSKQGLVNKSNAQYQRFKFIFAIRSGLNGLLDVARRTFLEAIDEIEHERDRLQQDFHFGENDVQLVYTAARGYHLSIPTVVLDALLPRDQSMFIQRYQKGKKTLCTTETFISLDTRQKEAYQEITLMAGRAIEEVLTEIRSRQYDIQTCGERYAKQDG